MNGNDRTLEVSDKKRDNLIKKIVSKENELRDKAKSNVESQIVTKLLRKLLRAKSSKEILSYRSAVENEFNKRCSEWSERLCNRLPYDNIKMMSCLLEPMLAYYASGSYFMKACGIPFLQEHKQYETLDALEIIVLFYTLQIMDLLRDGFYNQISLAVYKDMSYEVVDHYEKVDYALRYANKHNDPLFTSLWRFYLDTIAGKKESIIYVVDNKTDCIMHDEYHIFTESYEQALDYSYTGYKNSGYSFLINKIIGCYQERFTTILYITEYQPMFVRVAEDYVWMIENFQIDIKKEESEEGGTAFTPN